MRSQTRTFPTILYSIAGYIAIMVFLVAGHATAEIMVIIGVTGALVLGAVVMWSNANARAKQAKTTHAWWQDNQCSGWRGY